MDPGGDGTVSKEKGGREEKKCVCMEVQREGTGLRSIDSSSGTFVFPSFFRKRGGYSLCPAVSSLSARYRESPCQRNDHRPLEEQSRWVEIKQEQTGREAEKREGMRKLRGIEWTGRRQGRKSKRAGRFRRLGGGEHRDDRKAGL